MTSQFRSRSCWRNDPWRPKRLLLERRLWWVVVGSAGLCFVDPGHFFVADFGLLIAEGRVVVVEDSVPNHECYVAGFNGSRRSVCRSGVGVLSVSLQRKPPRTVGALWPGRVCEPPCAVCTETRRGHRLFVFAGRVGALVFRGLASNVSRTACLRGRGTPARSGGDVRAARAAPAVSTRSRD